MRAYYLIDQSHILPYVKQYLVDYKVIRSTGYPMPLLLAPARAGGPARSQGPFGPSGDHWPHL